MSARRLALAAALMAAAGAPAAAQTVSAAAPEGLVAAMQAAGFRARLGTDSYGDPMIESGSAGVSFRILFYGCTGGQDCRDVQFSAGFDLARPLGAEAVNSWNLHALMGKAHVDEEGDPFLEHYVAGLDGHPAASFERLLDEWDEALRDFMDFIDW